MQISKGVNIFIFFTLTMAKRERKVVEVGAIFKGKGIKMQDHLEGLVTTMLNHSIGIDIKLTLLSDEDSWPLANRIVRDIFALHLTEGLIFGLKNLATIEVEYADIDHLTSTYMDQDLLKSMKRIFGPANKTLILMPDDPRRESYYPNIEPESALAVHSSKVFDRDLFYIAPFYHRFFPTKEKMIVLDLDMRLQESLNKVDELFSTMDIQQVVAFALDQSAHYPFMLGATQNQQQGVNSGLALYNLKKMRESSDYNSELESERMEELSRRYLPQNDWVLAEQDWFSLLSWEQSHLVKILPCQYNVLRCSSSGGERTSGTDTKFFQNFPCNQEPVALHFCGTNDLSNIP